MVIGCSYLRKDFDYTGGSKFMVCFNSFTEFKLYFSRGVEIDRIYNYNQNKNFRPLL